MNAAAGEIGRQVSGYVLLVLFVAVAGSLVWEWFRRNKPRGPKGT
jgi:hypothetical protein